MSTQFAPDTADGWSVLHQFFTLDWTSLNKFSESEREDIVGKSAAYLSEHEALSDAGQSACFHILGHKGSFLLLHFRPSFTDCVQVELDVARLPLAPYMQLVDSYVSVIELGMYHISKKIIEELLEKGLKPHSEEWKAEHSTKIAPHKESLKERCFAEIPDKTHYCFYPMNKRRGESYNWYAMPIAERATYMMEHGMTGRRYAGRVKQIISGSIGFDDWEWGVDLFADNPLDLKNLIYDMRFDDATSLYGEFGKFYTGIRVKTNRLIDYFNGKLSSAQ